MILILGGSFQNWETIGCRFLAWRCDLGDVQGALLCTCAQFVRFNAFACIARRF